MHPLTKQPSESRIYAVNFSANLTTGETIVASPVPVVTPTPSGLTITSVAPDSTGKKVQFRIAGGTDGVQYKLTVTATTSLGNALEEDVDLVVENT